MHTHINKQCEGIISEDKSKFYKQVFEQCLFLLSAKRNPDTYTKLKSVLLRDRSGFFQQAIDSTTLKQKSTTSFHVEF